MPLRLSSLLNRMRTSLLVLLVLVLPLQSVAQLAAGLQGHRHMHAGAARTAWVAQSGALALLTAPLRAVLTQLHAAQDPRLGGPTFGGLPSRGPAAGLHQHGGVFHEHVAHTQDVIDVGEPGDEGPHAGMTLFLAWLPIGPVLAAGQGGDRPATATHGWHDHVVAPLLAPPRG